MNWCTTEHLDMPIFTVKSCDISSETWRRHLLQIWTNAEHASCVKRMDLCRRNRSRPHVEEPFALAEMSCVLRLGESQTLYKRSVLWEFVCA